MLELILNSSADGWEQLKGDSDAASALPSSIGAVVKDPKRAELQFRPPVDFADLRAMGWNHRDFEGSLRP